MTLEDWLRQDRTLADQLKVVEGLCSALNDGHQRGDVHRALEPGNIEVASDGTCDLSAALSGGGGATRYRAPEMAEGAPPSQSSDIYSAGVIFYEMLSGKSPAADRPSPLADLRPDVPRDLTDAIMGCLEKGPDWRPKDLSYLLQVVRTLRSQGAGKGVRTPARVTEGPKSSARSAAPSARRTPAKGGGSTNNAPLFIAAALLVVGAGAGAWFWFKGPSSGPRTAAARPTPAPVTTSTTLAVAETPTTVATTLPSAKAAPVAATPTPLAEATPRPTPTPTPPPTTLAARAAEPTPTPTPVPTPTPAPVAAAEEAPVALEPTVLTAVSPLQVKRGATTILDVRGTGLRASQKATILKIKESPNGISVVRQKFVNAGLVQVIVKLEENASPGAYGLAMADPGGSASNALSFTVGK